MIALSLVISISQKPTYRQTTTPKLPNLDNIFANHPAVKAAREFFEKGNMSEFIGKLLNIRQGCYEGKGCWILTFECPKYPNTTVVVYVEVNTYKVLALIVPS
jgi:hypothetical protein